MLLFAAAFVAGVCILQAQAVLPPWSGIWALPLLALAAWWRQDRIRPILLLLLALGLGFYWAAWRADLRLAQKLPTALTWQDIIVEGTVHGLPDIDQRRTRFDFDITRVVSPPMPLSLRVRLSDYHRRGRPLTVIANHAKLQMVVRIRPPVTRANPHNFDYAGYLFGYGIRAVGYVRERDKVAVLQAGGGWREELRQRALALPQGGLLTALIVGDRSGLQKEQWQVLQRTGTAHLLSISGTHITLAAGFAALLVGWLWRRCRFTRYMPAQKAALLAALPAALGYALLAGFGVPTQRSFFMFLAAAIALLLGGISAVSRSLAIAALVVVIIDPWAVLSAGFWLSFMLATAVVFAIDGGGGDTVDDAPMLTTTQSHPGKLQRLWQDWKPTIRGKRGGMLWQLLRLQFLVSLFAVPLTLWFFNQASLVSPLANVVAVPVVGLLALPAALLDILLPGDILWHFAGWVLNGLWHFLEFLSASNFAAWYPAAPPWWLFALACAGSVWMIMPAGMPARWAGVLPIAAMLFWQQPSLPHGTFRATVLDIGQGSAMVVETASRTLIYDAGPRFAASVIKGFLRGKGLQHLDLLMISHDDYDHSGGAAELLAAYAAPLSSSLPPSHPAVRQATTHQPCTAGQAWQWDGVAFAVLHPPPQTVDLPDNAMSCVLKISSGKTALLLTGDIPGSIENDLAAAGTPLPAEVLLASHHGSNSSSTAKFLAAVSPRAVLFSIGANNRYGHPNIEVLARARAIGAKIYRTDQHGAIIIDADAHGTRIHTLRTDQPRRYWEE